MEYFMQWKWKNSVHFQSCFQLFQLDMFQKYFFKLRYLVLFYTFAIVSMKWIFKCQMFSYKRIHIWKENTMV